MPKGKPAAKPTRWWAVLDAACDPGNATIPDLCGTRKDARAIAAEWNEVYDDPGRFVVRRVEIREV